MNHAKLIAEVCANAIGAPHEVSRMETALRRALSGERFYIAKRSQWSLGIEAKTATAADLQRIYGIPKRSAYRVLRRIGES